MYRLVIIVITDVLTPKTNKRRFIEVRGLFCYNEKYDIDDVVKKATVALKQYAEEKGYDKSFVENFKPYPFEMTVGVMDSKEVKEFMPNFEFEICDKKYSREGGYVDNAPFPENWVELSDSDIRKIIHNYIIPFYARHEVGEWTGRSRVIEDFEEVK